MCVCVCVCVCVYVCITKMYNENVSQKLSYKQTKQVVD